MITAVLSSSNDAETRRRRGLLAAAEGVTFYPALGPVVLKGDLDVSSLPQGATGLVGLKDATAAAAAGSTCDLAGAYISATHAIDGSSFVIGLSDGFAGGAFIKPGFLTIPAEDMPASGVLQVVFTLDGTQDPTTCSGSASDAGCMTLQVDGTTVASPAVAPAAYGALACDASAQPEFGHGAVLETGSSVPSLLGQPMVAWDLSMPTAAKPTTQYVPGATVCGWYEDRKAPSAWEAVDAAGRPGALQITIAAADLDGNNFKNTQGRKHDVFYTLQAVGDSVTVQGDLFIPADWMTTSSADASLDRRAELWLTAGADLTTSAYKYGTGADGQAAENLQLDRVRNSSSRPSMRAVPPRYSARVPDAFVGV